MGSLTKIEQMTFGTFTCDIYQNHNGDFYMTREQIGAALEYKNPQKAIDNIHSRNKSRLDPLSVTLNLRGTDGKEYNTIVYSAKGIYEICRWSRQPKANAFYDYVYELLEGLRTGYLKIQIQKQTQEWQSQRAIGKPIRKSMTDAIQDNLDKGPWSYKLYTDLAYKSALGKTAAQLRKECGAPANANARDFLSADELERVSKAESGISALIVMGFAYEQIKALLSQRLADASASA